MTLFRKGIEWEREGNYYEATRCYKRALKLDPDVERKIDYNEPATRPMDTSCKNSLCLLNIYTWSIFLLFFVLKQMSTIKAMIAKMNMTTKKIFFLDFREYWDHKYVFRNIHNKYIIYITICIFMFLICLTSTSISGNSLFFFTSRTSHVHI